MKNKKESYAALLDYQKEMENLMSDCVEKEVKVELLNTLANGLNLIKETSSIGNQVLEEITQLEHDVYMLKDRIVDLEEKHTHYFGYGCLGKFASHRANKIASVLDDLCFASQEEGDYIETKLRSFETN